MKKDEEKVINACIPQFPEKSYPFFQTGNGTFKPYVNLNILLCKLINNICVFINININ